MRQVRSVVILLFLFLIGLLVAAWQFIAPWVVGFQQGWTHATWGYVWTAAIVLAVSGIALVTVSSTSVAGALRFAAQRRAAEAERDEHGEHGEEVASDATS